MCWGMLVRENDGVFAFVWDWLVGGGGFGFGGGFALLHSVMTMVWQYARQNTPHQLPGARTITRFLANL